MLNIEDPQARQNKPTSCLTASASFTFRALPSLFLLFTYAFATTVLYFDSARHAPGNLDIISKNDKEVPAFTLASMYGTILTMSTIMLLSTCISFYPRMKEITNRLTPCLSNKTKPEQNEVLNKVHGCTIKKVQNGVATVLNFITAIWKAIVSTASLYSFLKNNIGEPWLAIASSLSPFILLGNLAAQFAVLSKHLPNKSLQKCFPSTCCVLPKSVISHILTLVYNAPNAFLYLNTFGRNPYLSFIFRLPNTIKFPILLLSLIPLVTATQNSYSAGVQEQLIGPNEKNNAQINCSSTLHNCITGKPRKLLNVINFGHKAYNVFAYMYAIAFKVIANLLSIAEVTTAGLALVNVTQPGIAWMIGIYSLATIFSLGNLAAQISILKPTPSPLEQCMNVNGHFISKPKRPATNQATEHLEKPTELTPLTN